MKKISFSSAGMGEKVAGVARIMSKRHMGKILFADCRILEEIVQLMFSSRRVTNFKEVCSLPVGSLINVMGEKIVTRTNTPSLLVSSCDFIHICKTVLPDKFRGMSDGLRYRNRCLDLMVDRESFDCFKRFSDVTMLIRQFLYKNSYHEFATGILQETFEAGQAKPFKTFCNAMSKDLYLSLTSELKLKRLLVAGFDRVFEITQSFRNEGIDSAHSPEFTILEIYTKDCSCLDMLNLLESMIVQIAKEVNLESELDFTSPFERISFVQAFEKYVGSYSECTLEILSVEYPRLFNREMATSTWLMKVIDKIISPKIKDPTFLTELPTGMSPLTMVLPCGEFTDRAFFVADGISIADIYTDENNPDILRENLKRQSIETGGVVNDSFLSMLSLGLGPSAGIGLGINRFHMLFLGSLGKNIKETILYPLLK